MRPPKLLTALLAAALVAGGAATANAGIVYNEAASGDLSNNAAAPTPLPFEIGINVVLGTVVGGSDQRDYLTFTMPPGSRLVALRLQQYVDSNNSQPGNTGFHGFTSGPTSVTPSMATASQFLGGDHLDGSQQGTDLLPALGATPAAGGGFTVPLPAGTYSYVIQQTGSNDPTTYRLQFEIRCSGAAQAVNYGTGKPGTNGVPTFTSVSLPVMGATSDVTIGNGLPGATPGLLFLGSSAASLPFDGGLLLVNPSFSFSLPPLGPGGSLSIPFTLPPTPSLCGGSLFLQSVFVDPAATGFYKTAQTPGLQLILGS